MNKYAGLSDFEINKKVANKLGFQSEIRENGTWLFNKIWIPFDPCNEPGQAMPIIIENCIGILPYKNSQPLAFDLQKGLGSGILIENKNIYRAAMEVFLMMKDGENNND